MAFVPLPILRRSPVFVPASLVFFLTVLPCASADARFSISTKVEGRRLLVIGSNSLDHDLVCDYTISLRMGALKPEDRSPSHAQQLKTPHGQISVMTSGATLTGIGGQGAPLPRGALDHVLESREFRAEIAAADLTDYGCRPKETVPTVEKDQSRPPFDKR
jgi:hypothetical protein